MTLTKRPFFSDPIAFAVWPFMDIAEWKPHEGANGQAVHRWQMYASGSCALRMTATRQL
jgi:hypothetical protein